MLISFRKIREKNGIGRWRVKWRKTAWYCIVYNGLPLYVYAMYSMNKQDLYYRIFLIRLKIFRSYTPSITLPVERAPISLAPRCAWHRGVTLNGEAEHCSFERKLSVIFFLGFFSLRRTLLRCSYRACGSLPSQTPRRKEQKQSQAPRWVGYRGVIQSTTKSRQKE